MSKKTFGTILKIAGVVALTAVTFGVGAAVLGGVSAGLSLGAALGAVSLTTLGTVVLASGLIAINIGNALSRDRPTINAVQDIGGRLNIRQDPNAFRDVLIGTVATAGVLRYKNLIEGIDDEPDTLWLVLVLAGYPCDGLDSFIFNGQTITVNGDGSTDGAFAGKLFVYFRKGDETDHAFPALVDGVWDAKARRGRGLCCAAIKVINDEVFEGKVEPVFVVRGAKLFDPRLDSAWGGSGSHDFADDTTFEHSNNPSQVKLTFLRGFYIQDSGANDVLIAGRGLKDKETTRFDFANWIASANTDEDQIPVVGGGNIDRYTADGIIQVSRPPADTIKILDAAQAGTTVFSGGKYRSYPGIYRAPTLTFGEADIIGVPKRLDIRKGQDGIVNIVHGSFASADDRYELRDYPRQKDTASITRVGEMQQELNLPFTTDHRMAQRIALISMRQANAQRSFTATFSHRALRLAPGGETVQINYPHFDFTNEVMRLTTWALIPAEDKQGMPGLNVDMMLVQDLSTFYSWTAASDEQSITTPGQMPGARGPGALTVQQINERRDAKTFLRFTGGADNKVEIPDDAAWDLPASTTRSIEFAFKPAAVGSQEAIISKRAAADGKGWLFEHSAIDSKLRFVIDTGAGAETMLSDADLEAGRWHHVAVTRDATGVFNLYLDKILQSATLTDNTDLSNSAVVKAGVNFNDLLEFAGNFQDLRIWSDVRTLAEIGQNALAVLIGDEAGLPGLWRCDEGHGSLLNNRGSVANTGGIISDLGTKIFWAGPAGESIPAADAALTNTGQLQNAVGIDQGDATVFRTMTRGMNFAFAEDGDVWTFDPSYQEVPTITFGSGGLSVDTTALTQPLFQDYNGTNLSISGVTSDILLSEESGTPTLRTDTGPTAGGGGDPDQVMNKALAAEAWDNKYTFKHNVTIQPAEELAPGEPGNPSTITVGYYSDDGGGFVLRGTQVFSNFNLSVKNITDALKVITVSGLGLNDDYGLSEEAETENGGSVGTWTNVTYSTATAPGTTPATNSTTGPVPMYVWDGLEGGISL